MVIHPKFSNVSVIYIGRVDQIIDPCSINQSRCYRHQMKLFQGPYHKVIRFLYINDSLLKPVWAVLVVKDSSLETPRQLKQCCSDARKRIQVLPMGFRTVVSQQGIVKYLFNLSKFLDSGFSQYNRIHKGSQADSLSFLDTFVQLRVTLGL